MVNFENVTKIYNSHLPRVKPTVALENISFEIKEKEFISIVGRSGAGKTTLLKMILGEDKPSQGKVFFEGTDIHQIRHDKLPEFRQKIGVVFQDYKLLSKKTAYENVAYALEVIGASDEEIAVDVPKVLELVGLGERQNSFPSELSGGEKQRLTIARALIHRPKIILADEPTGNLDPYHTLDIIKILLRINEMGTTLVLATHNREVVNSLEKRVITLEKGKIIKDEEKGRFIL